MSRVLPALAVFLLAACGAEQPIDGVSINVDELGVDVLVDEPGEVAIGTTGSQEQPFGWGGGGWTYPSYLRECRILWHIRDGDTGANITVTFTQPGTLTEAECRAAGEAYDRGFREYDLSCGGKTFGLTIVGVGSYGAASTSGWTARWGNAETDVQDLPGFACKTCRKTASWIDTSTYATWSTTESIVATQSACEEQLTAECGAASGGHIQASDVSYGATSVDSCLDYSWVAWSGGSW